MLNVQIDASALTKLSRDLSRVSARTPQEFTNGLNAGGDRVRTAVRHAIQDQTSLVRYSSVVQRTRSSRAYPGSPIYTIYVSGKATKQPEFKTIIEEGAGGGVTIVLWKKAHKFKRSFQQKFKGGLRARLGGPRFPTRAFDGPNLAKEAIKDDSAKTFIEAAEVMIAPLILTRLVRLFT